MITGDATAWCVESTIKTVHWFGEQQAVIHVTASGDLHLISNLARKILDLLSSQSLCLHALFVQLRQNVDVANTSFTKEVLESQLLHLLHLGVVRKVRV